MNLSDKRIFTIPNLISIIRILLIIPFVATFITDNYIASAVILVLSGVSDMLDGLIARKFNQISELGLILDPLADKLTLVAAVVCVSVKIPQLIPLTFVLFTKELLMLVGGFLLIKKSIRVPASRWYGKVATIVFYISATVLVYINAILKVDSSMLSLILTLITTIFMIFALIKYIKLFIGILTDNSNKSLEGENIN